MLNKLCSLFIHRFILCLVLFSFFFTCANPVFAGNYQVGFNEAAFMVRLEGLVEKLKKSQKKSTDCILSTLVDIKNEIEWTYGKEIDIDSHMNQVSKEISKSGQKVPKKELDEIKRILKGKIKKKKNHERYLTDTMYIDGYVFNLHDEMAFYEANHPNENKDTKEIILPAMLVWGVTVSLCGLFIFCVPLPTCQAWGTNLMIMGVSSCATVICEEIDRKNKEKK